MTLGDKLTKLRKENNYTQEQLADILGVSRQALSKWENNAAYPETDKLIRMSELFDCSLDYLLKDNMENDRSTQPKETEFSFSYSYRKKPFEKKSEKTLWGMPLWHIGRNAKGIVAFGVNASGIVAFGVKAKGIISCGVLSIGILSFGTLSIGLISIGLLALGIMCAGCFAIGVLAAGAICLGIISFGAIAAGEFAVGALAIGKYFALGDNARAMLAVGDTKAVGSVFQKIGKLTAQDVATIKNALDSLVPDYLYWAKEFIKMFL